MKWYRRFTLVGVAFITMGVLSGCGTGGGANSGSTPVPNVSNTISSTSNNTTTSAKSINTKTTNLTANNTSFPDLVKKAMNKFPPNVLDQSEAPMTLPASPTPLSSRTWDMTTGPVLSYNVLLSSGGNQLAMFAGSKYPSSSMAGETMWLPGNLINGGKLSKSTVSVAKEVSAQGESFNLPKPSAKENSFGQLRWKHNNWAVQITNNRSARLPIKEAKSIAEELDKEVLPKASRGTIFVDISSRNQMTVYIKWQNALHVHEVDTYSACQNPIKTGIAMAKSMNFYSQH